jgi:phage shock protein PspC (stress-responsive transcriptional regulator)
VNEISRRKLDVDRAYDPRVGANLPAPRLWRSRSNRVVLGVIGGLAEKFGWETRPVRILWGFLGLLTLPLAGLPVVIPYVTIWAITEGRGPAGPARSLRRSRTNQVFAGVLAGVADWLGIRPSVTRVLYSFLTLATFIVPGIVTYLVLWAKMPADDPGAEEGPAPRRLSV